MNPTIKNVLALIAGAIIGMGVNYGILILGSYIIPLPDGMTMHDIESIKANAHKFETMHFIVPFIAHAGGTLVGAFIAAKYAAYRQLLLAMLIGAFFLVGGITAAQDIPGPKWFTVLDLVGAYIPMAWLGHKLATK